MQRLYSRVEYFCDFCCFKTIAFFAISFPPYFANGAPIIVSSSFASSSVLAVVTNAMSIPRIFSILSYSISGKMSCSLSEMLSNTERTADVLEYDRNLMDTLEREKESLGDRKSELENARKAQEKAKNELAEDKNEAQSKTSDMQAYIDKLANDTAKTEQMLADAQKLDDELNARLEQALKALAEKEVPQYTVDKNSMMWPVSVNYNTISSPYGMRYIFGSNYMHYGIDIPAPAGSNVYACQSGVVEIATSHSSYGNYIVINHGGGYATLYAHNSQLLVSAGTQVSKGDVIALVGRTGSATGNHCHLEVRYNGAHQNPLNFLTQP